MATAESVDTTPTGPQAPPLVPKTSRISLWYPGTQALSIPKYRSSWYSNAILLVGEKVFFQNVHRDEKASEDDKSSVDDEDSEDGKAKSGFCAINSLSLFNLTSTTFFEMYLQTLMFGLLLYVADTISDIANAVLYYLNGDDWWAGLTVAVVLLPGLVRGTYEVFRREIIYKSLADERTQQPGLTLESQKIFTRLNLGLDVLPSASIDLSNTNVPAKIILAPLYVILMAVIFPFLPIIQYCKVFFLQWKIKYKKSERMYGDESILEEATEEMKRAISLKAVEAFMEAAPQFFLQIYITYKRKQADAGWLALLTPFVAMGFSFLSLLKTSYDLQEVDRLDHAVSSAARPMTFFWTSNFFFSTVICFRSLTISVLGLFLSHFTEHRGIIAAPLASLFVLNILIRICFQRSGALLAGAMSAVAPAKFICASKTSREKKTRNYLIVYTVFNTGAHVASIVAVYILDPDFDADDGIVNKDSLWLYFLPVLAVLAFASTLATYLHWRFSLKHLFRSDVKFPEFSDKEVRIKTYPKNWHVKYGSLSPQRLSENGLFCQITSSGPRLCCFDCGLTMPLLTSGAKTGNDVIDERLSLVHAALHFGYRIHYLSSFKSDRAVRGRQNPDILRQAYSKLFRVKPECGVLKKRNINFGDEETRLKSFRYMSSPKDLMAEYSVSPEEVSAAGYVRLSPMTAACYTCFHVLDWSNSKTRFHSPWALHIWNKADTTSSECPHVTKCLKKLEIRLKTYPKEWLDLTDEAALANPQSLSEAGFYCSVWQHGRAWIKCFSCTAHAFHWPKTSILNRQQLAAAAKLTTTEIPGLAYNNDTAFVLSYASEVPIVDHYLQQPNCSFIQQCFESESKRKKTYPENWADINGLAVSVDEIAHAGFVYFPNDETSRKFRVNQVAMEKCSVTQCPKCLMIVDWTTEARNPADIMHCDARTNLLKQITQMRKNRSEADILIDSQDQVNFN